MSDAYTLVVTSCCRFDLLERSLGSFYAHADVAPAEVIVVEDSADVRVRDVVGGLGRPAQVLVRGTRLGQMQAIDHAYSRVSTPLIFHCEDDWLFVRGGFIAQSARVLQAREDVSMVGLRPRSELNPLVRSSPVEVLDGVEYFAMDPRLHPEYFSHSFNPGLRRLSDYKRIGPYARLGEEADVSYAYKVAGFRIANLEAPAVRHIGDGRHIDDPAQRVRARTFGARLVRSVRKRVKRLRRALGEQGAR